MDGLFLNTLFLKQEKRVKKAMEVIASLTHPISTTISGNGGQPVSFYVPLLSGGSTVVAMGRLFHNGEGCLISEPSRASKRYNAS
jgi:hypothetical protein